jgi:hypothetical protein
MESGSTGSQFTRFTSYTFAISPARCGHREGVGIALSSSQEGRATKRSWRSRCNQCPDEES